MTPTTGDPTLNPSASAGSRSRPSLEVLLRIAALIIAALALIDPTLTFASRRRPIVALSLVESPSLARTISGSETGLDRARRVRARIATNLANAFEVREGPTPDAAAQVLIGDGSYPAETPLVEHSDSGDDANAARAADASASGARVPVYGVTIDTTSTPNVRVLRIDAPARTRLTSRVRVAATVEARGMAGRMSTISLRADDLDMARTTHAWTQPIETATIALDVVPFRTGLTRLRVAADPLPSETTTTDNAVDTAIDITSERIAVLFVDARPSWMTRFARQALEADDRIAIKTLSRVSRGLTATTPEAPRALTLASLEPFAVVVVGAPEALTRADVDALRQFARVRGGLVIFAPDRHPSGAYLDLLPARAFDDKLQEEPAAIHFGPASAAAAPALSASELSLARDLLPGSEVLARLGDPRTGAPVIISSPAGDGEVLFIGALDAWRYRTAASAAQADKAVPAANAQNASSNATGAANGTLGGFDAAWRQLVATRGARVAAPIEVSLATSIAAPDQPVAVSVRLRKTLIAAAGDANGGTAGSAPPLTARLIDIGPASDTTREGHEPRESRVPREHAREPMIRLWPTDQHGRFAARLNAPSRPGVYAISVEFDRGTPPSRATLLVASPAPVATVAWDGLRTFVDAHGGHLFPAADLPRLIEHLQQHVYADSVARARHPFRSAWWIAPFAACLGGEWWLRRRRGQR